MSDWNKKDIWSKRGKDFMVQISRHEKSSQPQYFGEGINCWAVYAYIYPEHRLFDRFEGSDMWQEAASCLPLHKGPSFLKIHRNDTGDICSYQVGADYSHAYDEHFSEYSNLDEAYQVKRDAQELFDWLSPLAE